MILNIAVNVPLTDVVHVIKPVEFNDKPVGRPVAAQIYGVVPPDAETLVE